MIDIQFLDDIDATIVELKQSVSAREIANALRDEIEPRLTRHVVWVVRRGTVDNLSTDDLKSFAGPRRAVMEKRPQGHTFFVSEGDAERALMRWYVAYGERVEQAPVGLHVMRTLDEALEKIREINAGSESKADRA